MVQNRQTVGLAWRRLRGDLYTPSIAAMRSSSSSDKTVTLIVDDVGLTKLLLPLLAPVVNAVMAADTTDGAALDTTGTIGNGSGASRRGLRDDDGLLNATSAVVECAGEPGDVGPADRSAVGSKMAAVLLGAALTERNLELSKNSSSPSIGRGFLAGAAAGALATGRWSDR
jgi:hypothetical protein